MSATINRLDNRLVIMNLLPMLDEASLLRFRSTHKRGRALVDSPNAVYETQLRRFFPTHFAALIQEAKQRRIPVRSLVERCVAIGIHLKKEEPLLTFEIAFQRFKHALQRNCHGSYQDTPSRGVLRQRLAGPTSEETHRSHLVKKLQNPSPIAIDVFRINFFNHLDEHLAIVKQLITEAPYWNTRFTQFLTNKTEAMMLDQQAVARDHRLTSSPLPQALDIVFIGRHLRFANRARALREKNEADLLTQDLIREAEKRLAPRQNQQQAFPQ
jgi:hypothetical protein